MYERKVTKREILFSIAIVAIMLVIGFVIADKIDNALMNKYQEYNTALQINDDHNQFVYAMKTNVGNSFVYGELKALDTVTYPEIGGEYSYIEKVKERYTEHTRTVTKTRTVNGKTESYTEVETYWTWDRVGSDSKHSEMINFLGVDFEYGVIPFPSASHIDTIRESYYVRYVYYGSPIDCTGTVYGELQNNTVNDARFYDETDITTTIENLETGIQLIVFWVCWMLLIAGVMILFYYIDNTWLE